MLTIGNTLNTGATGKSKGILTIASNSKYVGQFADINENGLTGNRGYYIPDKSGTLALTSDIFNYKTTSTVITEVSPNGGSYVYTPSKSGYLTILAHTVTVDVDFNIGVRDSNFTDYGQWFRGKIGLYATEPLGIIFVHSSRSYTIRNLSSDGTVELKFIEPNYII